MSFPIQAWASKQQIGSPAEKAVLWELSQMANEDHDFCAWPSIDTLARSCGTSRSSVQRAIAGLVRRGIVERRGKTSRRKYRLMVDEKTAAWCRRVSRGTGLKPTQANDADLHHTDPRSGRDDPGSSHGDLQTCKETKTKLLGGAGAPSRQQGENKKSKPDARGTRLPADWQPSADDIAAAQKWAPAVDWAEEAEKFRNHWIAKAGKDATKLDWSATWRNWLINAATYARRRGAGAGGKSWGTPPKIMDSAPRAEPWRKRVEGFRKDGEWLSNWGPPPGSERGCRVPVEVLERCGYGVSG